MNSAGNDLLYQVGQLWEVRSERAFHTELIDESIFKLMGHAENAEVRADFLSRVRGGPAEEIVGRRVVRWT